MRQQSQIQRTLGGAEGIARITTLLERERFSSRSDLGRRVCEEFDFRDRLGRLQLSGCLNALRVIEQRCDSIVLPVAGTAVPRAGRPSLLAEGVRLAESVPEHLSQVRRLRILVVGGPRQRRVWNTLIAHHHPCGMTTFAGAQMRYLVDSEHGWLAAVGFSAAALRLAAREQWIGWSDRQRRAHLDKLVCLSRFLTGGGCANLASVQSQIISAVGPCFFSNCSDAQTAGNPNNQRIRSPWIGKLRLRIRQGRIPAGTRLALRAPAGYARGGPRVRPAGPWSAQPCKFDMPQT